MDFPESVPKILYQASNTEYIRQDGEGDSTETAPVFYIPILSHTNGIYMTTGESATSLIAGSEAHSQLSIPVEVSISEAGESWDIFIAAQKSDSKQYQVIYNFPNVANGQSLNLTPNLKDICDADNDLNLDCSDFQAGESDQEEIVLFLGIGTQGEVDHTPSADSIDPENYSKGHYIVLKLNSIITTQAPTPGKLYKGENRLQVTFQGMEIQDVDGLYAYVTDLGTITDDTNCEKMNQAVPTTYDALTKGEHRKLGTTSTVGKSTVKSLRTGTVTRFKYTTGINMGLPPVSPEDSTPPLNPWKSS